ncbi:hypothetical protein DPSP01_000470 [Paraphaeosphaeria sporulosa]
MSMPTHKRARSDPPPILVEDTATAETDMGRLPRSQTAYARDAPQPTSYRPRPEPQSRESYHDTTRQRRNNTWERGHRRQRSPNIEWHEKWTKDSWQNGRVLLIDYVDKNHTTQGRRKIVAQEFNDVEGLRNFYQNEELSGQAALRVIHVQNASWATRFLLRKFNIDATDDLVGTSFGRWARYERPQRRANKPVLNGKTFRTQRDPWRGISRTSFGCDYLKHYPANQVVESDYVKSTKMMALNHYDEYDLPAHTYDVHVQRLSVYVQLSYDEPGGDVDPDISNPYDEEEYQYHENLKKQYNADDYVPKLKTLDNGNTIILFEHSQTGSVEDTLVKARQEIELRWRRLTFYMPRSDTEDDGLMVPKCMDLILRDIFRALAQNWEKYSNICEVHTGILEDKIYENPADETRAPELWTNASLWLKVERLMYLHIDLIKETRAYLHELDNSDPSEDGPWLESSAEEMEKLTTLFQEGVVKPTDNLSDLMYKSVGIRDARHSLQLGLSMWRLSWITFVFLPLTFTTGFFGMNVDTFAENPSIKYFLIAVVALFTVSKPPGGHRPLVHDEAHALLAAPRNTPQRRLRAPPLRALLQAPHALDTPRAPPRRRSRRLVGRPQVALHHALVQRRPHHARDPPRRPRRPRARDVVPHEELPRAPLAGDAACHATRAGGQRARSLPPCPGEGARDADAGDAGRGYRAGRAGGRGAHCGEQDAEERAEFEELESGEERAE